MPLAAAAYAEMLAKRLGTLLGTFHEAHNSSLHESAVAAAYLNVHYIAHHGHGNEHHLSVVAAHRFAFGGKGRYFEPFNQGQFFLLSCH